LILNGVPSRIKLTATSPYNDKQVIIRNDRAFPLRREHQRTMRANQKRRAQKSSRIQSQINNSSVKIFLGRE